VAEIDNILTTAFRDVVQIILSPQYADLKPGQKARIMTLFARTSQKIAGGYGDAADFMYDTSLELGSIESQLAASQLAALVADTSEIRLSTIAPLDDATVKAIAEFPIEGLNFGDWWAKQAADMALATKRQIQIGIINGETPGSIVKRILPVGLPGEPAVLKTARNSSQMIVRTSFTTVRNQAALKTYQQAGRGKVSDSYKYVAVRDSRTSPICRALDGKVFKYADPKKKVPPQHPNCRSTIIPVVDYGALGIDKTSEQVLSFGSYDKWLKDQPESTVASILGARGASLYNSGKVSLADIVAQDGRRLTTSQLATAFGVG
jgi:SPP1 gp7 family putative phage head morphogenesis protein